MLTRRAVLAMPAALAAPSTTMTLCLHQTTLAAAGYRRSIEGAAKAGIKLVEVIPAQVKEFVEHEGMPAARRVLSDLGMKVVSGSGARGLFEPHPGQAKAVEDLKVTAPMMAELGVDRLVCPCGATDQFKADDYKRGIDNAHTVGDIVKPYGIVAMLEFMRLSTFIGTLPTALQFTRDAAHPNVKPMFDCYHFWSGLSKFEDLDLIASGEIHHAHFQDVPRFQRELYTNWTREIPGDGVSPLTGILQALQRKGYHGPLSVELFYPHIQKGDPYEVCAEIRRKAEAVMRQAKVLA
jgi:2-keto-myo-inositol isomerase